MLRLSLAVVLLVVVATNGKTRRPYPFPSKLAAQRRFWDVLDEDESKIVGGEDAVEGEVPFQVSVQTTSGFHFCGGSIISEEWVLCAAHCLEGDQPGDVIVKAGGLDVTDLPVTAEVAEIFVNELFGSPIQFANDVSLMRLTAPLDFNDNVQAVTMADDGEVFTGFAAISGWGTLTAGGSSPDELQIVKGVPVVTDDDCNESYPNEIDYPTMICAGRPEGGLDSCQGDSGGPMTCEADDGTTKHCGIVSWGYSCAAPGYPGVYSETAGLRAWILENSGV